MRYVLAIFLLSLCACSGTGSVPIKQYQLRGEVVQLAPQDHVALIKGEKVEGWMDAMTMEYRVKDDAEFRALHPGEHISATVNVQDVKYWLSGIHALP